MLIYAAFSRMHCASKVQPVCHWAPGIPTRCRETGQRRQSCASRRHRGRESRFRPQNHRSDTSRQHPRQAPRGVYPWRLLWEPASNLRTVRSALRRVSSLSNLDLLTAPAVRPAHPLAGAGLSTPSQPCLALHAAVQMFPGPRCCLSPNCSQKTCDRRAVRCASGQRKGR